MTVDKLFKAIQELHVMYCHQEPTPGRSQSKTHYKFKELTSFFSCVFFSPLFLFTRINFSCHRKENCNENFAQSYLRGLNTELKNDQRSY